MDPPPPPPAPNPQEESPRRIPQNALADVARPRVRAARGPARLLDHALLVAFLVAYWKIEDNRLIYPIIAIFLAFFGDNALRSITFLEATLIRQPLRPRECVLLGMLIVAKFNSMLAYGLLAVLLTGYSTNHVIECLFPEQPRPPRHLLTALAVGWLAVLFQYQWLIRGLFLGYVQDMPFTDSHGSRGLYTGRVNGVMLKPHDVGRLVYENGGKYTGYFEDGVKSSYRESIMEESNGDVLTGNFKDNKMDGYGTFMSGDRKIAFRGEMKDGKPNGRGVLAEKDGLVYEGEFVNAKKEGRGIISAAEGEKLVGSFRDGKLQGDGIFRGPDRFPLISGNFKDGLPHGPSLSVDRDLNMYLGNFENGKRHGQGLLITSKGVVQAGNWSDGQLHGEAKILYPGYSFSGQFKHGKKHGHGVATTGGKLVKYEGEWKDGERVDARNSALSDGTCADGDTCDEVEL